MNVSVNQASYSGNGKTIYEDKNECSFTGDEHPCPSEESGASCVNTFVHNLSKDTASLEGYKCGCAPKKGVIDGPEYDVHGPTTSCLDVGECCDNSTLHDCRINTACMNTTYSSFYCECLTGNTLVEGEAGCEEDDDPSVAPTTYTPMCPATEVDNHVSFNTFDNGSGVAHGWQ